MFIKQIDLQYFRCFERKTICFEQPIVLIEGANGSGKTSLLEALYYACYLRSFRTHSPRELMAFKQDTFCIKVDFESLSGDQLLPHNLQVGYSSKKRLVKLNSKLIGSFKELMDHFRIIALTEDDLGLIKLGPELRRQFVDQAISLYGYQFVQLLKEYKTIVDNRNRLLQHARSDRETYNVWTEQLWHKTLLIQQGRKQFLQLLHVEVNELLKTYFKKPIHIEFVYKVKKAPEQSYQAFMERHMDLFDQERRFGRSLFGAHLDDISIVFQGELSRSFASRGQQKLIMLLIKIAQLKVLYKQKGPATFLLDDFMTDFDQEHAEIVIEALCGLESQLIFTAPIYTSILGEMLQKQGAQKLKISG